MYLYRNVLYCTIHTVYVQSKQLYGMVYVPTVEPYPTLRKGKVIPCCVCTVVPYHSIPCHTMHNSTCTVSFLHIRLTPYPLSFCRHAVREPTGAENGLGASRLTPT